MSSGSPILKGQVCPGWGLCRELIAETREELKQILGEEIYPGSLNVVLNGPVLLRDAAAIRFDGGRRLIWPATLEGLPVWLYRWRHAPLHVVEVLSGVCLRDKFGLLDGGSVRISVDLKFIVRLPMQRRLIWFAVWGGRRDWSYKRERYYKRTMKACQGLGATQGQPVRRGELVLWLMKATIRRIPVIGPLAVRLKHGRSTKRAKKTFTYERISTSNPDETDADREFSRLRNVLNYTKLSGSDYDAQDFPAAYHTINIHGRQLKGQRDPTLRLKLVPIDFSGASVLDVGCNQGGMLLALHDQLRWGVGIDYDSRQINAANRLRQSVNAANLSFFVFDLEREPLDLIQDFLPEEKADVCFLLAVCMWIENWTQVIDFAQRCSEAMVFETNGTNAQQENQIAYLKTKYTDVTVLAETSEDDPTQKKRKFLYLTNPRR